MGRRIEQGLALVGALVSVGVAVVFAGLVASDPAAIVILAGVALLGLLGYMAVALDRKEQPAAWGRLTWVVAGALSAMVVLAGFSYGSFLIPAALAFLGAALLANRRRGRSLAVDIGFYLARAVACVLLILGGNALGWI